jgi:hypothetical protein
MALKAANVIVGSVGDKVKVETPTPLLPLVPHSLELTDKELELLLLTIKNGLFKGEYVEILFNLTLKLQNHLIHLRSKTDKS